MSILGRPPACPPEVLAAVIVMRDSGWRLIDVCEVLNNKEIPTPGGGPRWWPSHVSRLTRTKAAERMRINLKEIARARDFTERWTNLADGALNATYNARPKPLVAGHPAQAVTDLMPGPGRRGRRWC
jgi:hypothetical protein